MQPDQKSERDRRTRAIQFRYASLGLEFGGGLVGFVLLGWWIDSAFNTSPAWLIGLSVVGCIGGMYHIIRRAYEIQKDFQREAERSRDKPESR